MLGCPTSRVNGDLVEEALPQRHESPFNAGAFVWLSRRDRRVIFGNLPVHRLEETVQEIVAVGPGMPSFHHRVR